MSIESQLERILTKVENLETQITAHISGETTKERIYDNADMLRILKVSLRTLANYRGSGLLGFSKGSGRILYTQADLDAFLSKNHFKPIANA